MNVLFVFDVIVFVCVVVSVRVGVVDAKFESKFFMLFVDVVVIFFIGDGG